MSILEWAVKLGAWVWSYITGQKTAQDARRAALPAEAALSQDEHAQEALRKAEEAGQADISKPLGRDSWDELNKP